jgi:hypothetical protein
MTFVRGDRSVINFSGANSQAKSTVLRSKGSLFTPSGTLPSITTIAPNKLESIGNPYASAIEFSQIVYDGPPGILNKFWIWDPTLNTSTNFGGWQLLSPTVTGDFTPVPGGTVNYPSGVVNSRIQSGQAFFMMGGTLGGTVQFTEDAKVSGSANTFRQPLPSVNRQSLGINIFNANQQLADGVMVVWDRSFTNGIDEEDAIKMMNPTENLGILSNNTLLTLESKKSVISNDTIQLYIRNVRLSNYQFVFNPSHFSREITSVKLIDNFMNQTTTISKSDTSSYLFTISSDPASYDSTRFFIVLNAKNKNIPKHKIETTLIEEAGKQKSEAVNSIYTDGIASIYPNPIMNDEVNLKIEGYFDGVYQAQIQDILGNTILAKEVVVKNGQLLNKIFLPKKLVNGVYRLSLTNDKNKTVRRFLFVK